MIEVTKVILRSFLGDLKMLTSFLRNNVIMNPATPIMEYKLNRAIEASPPMNEGQSCMSP